MKLPMTTQQLWNAIATDAEVKSNTEMTQDDEVKSVAETVLNDVIKLASETVQDAEVKSNTEMTQDDEVKSVAETVLNDAVKETVLAVNDSPAVKMEPRKRNGLDQFSLTGLSSAMAKEMTAPTYVLDGIALRGEASIIYAAPNTGKTLIVLRLLMQSIKTKTINPSSIYYLNVDDNYNGLVQKLRIAEEFGFNMLAEGHKNFKASKFKNIIEVMIERKQCKGVIVIVDTLKKFADLMDKKKMREFNALVRVFVSLGGTFIALAHVNKKPDANGKPVYAGTTDTVEDFDCAYTLHKVREEGEFNYVQFENIKKRGNVVQLANYRYSNLRDISYDELLLSVEYVDSDDDFPFYEVEHQKSEKSLLMPLKL